MLWVQPKEVQDCNMNSNNAALLKQTGNNKLQETPEQNIITTLKFDNIELFLSPNC
jgi:hypothetical protein